METLRDALEAWTPEARARLGRLTPGPRLERFGRVERLGDGIALISGLPEARLDELLVFPKGVLGFAQALGHGEIGCVLLGDAEQLAAGDRVEGTGQVVRVPVGAALLGRVVDPLGRPLDGGPPVSAERLDPAQRPAPAILDRALVTEPLATGLTVIDAMFPIGRGQRELLVGDRSTGKTAIAVDTIINQRRTDVVCVYVAVGQRASSVRQVIEAVRRYGAIERCLFVVARADAAPGLQWLAPYAGFTMAEAFRDRGQHALIVLDDLTKHAATHRQLSLLLRQPAGREAYPGDVFYLHARLLERAAKLSAERGGGSLTALPIAETQAGNLSAYIPTNLISITDGQIALETKLFQEGQKPAVDVGRSVSRVGGKTQAAAMRRLAERLRLEYAQFLELEVFTRFGAMVDERTRRVIEHGRRIRALLAQPQYAPLPLELEVAQLLALAEGLLDRLALARWPDFRERLGPTLARRVPGAMAEVARSGRLEPAARAELVGALRELVDGLSAAPEEARRG